MILYLFVVFLLLSQGVFADKLENYTVRNTHWGMTPEEVKQEENNRKNSKKPWKKIKEEDNLICYEGKWKDTDVEAKVCFNFIDKRLISLEYEIQGDLNRFHSILHELKVKYNYNIIPDSVWIIHKGQTRLTLSHHRTIKILYESTEYREVKVIIDDL